LRFNTTRAAAQGGRARGQGRGRTERENGEGEGDLACDEAKKRNKKRTQKNTPHKPKIQNQPKNYL